MQYHNKLFYTVYDLKVHLIWITQHKHNVLTQDVANRTREVIREVCDEKKITILTGIVNKNYVYLNLSYPPKLSVHTIVKWFKQTTSAKLQSEFPHLEKAHATNQFWAIGYAAFSSGRISDDTIDKYVNYHTKHPNHNNDNFKINR